MSNIKFTDKIKAKPSNTPKAGQYYRDRTTGDVYILAKHDNAEQHSLIRLKDGVPYSLNAARDIIGAFGKDFMDFNLIENVEIVIS